MAGADQITQFLPLSVVMDSSLPHLTGSQRADIIKGVRIDNGYSKTGQSELHPDTALKSFLIRDLKELDPTIGIEVLQFLPWPENVCHRQGTSDIILRIYNILRSVSSMEGISYYSASRKKMRTLFVESYTLNNPEAGKKIPDVRVSVIPEYSKLYLYQRDLSFGKNISLGVYRYKDGIIALSFINLTALHYGIIPVAGPRKMNLTLLIVPTREGILFYESGAVRTVQFPGLETKIQISIRNRVTALADWFQVQLNK